MVKALQRVVSAIALLALSLIVVAQQPDVKKDENPDESCDIKGNISVNTGEKIYHVPGQRFYEETIIRPEYGERWFCTESEAKAAGWRKSKV